MAQNLGDYTQEDITKALRTIQVICRNHMRCDNCPFWDGDDNCIIEKGPDEWQIKGENNAVWRAFL